MGLPNAFDTWRRPLARVGLALAMTVAACGSDDAATPSGSAPDPLSRENAKVESGAQAVSKRRCTQCHGDNMAGATKPLAQSDPNVELYPPNLTPDIETGLGDPKEPDPAKRGYTDDLLALAIRTGIDKDGLTLCPQMKHFAEMTDFEVYSIVMYLRSLPPVKNKVLRSVCPPLKTKEEQLAASK